MTSWLRALEIGSMLSIFMIIEISRILHNSLQYHGQNSGSHNLSANMKYQLICIKRALYNNIPQFGALDTAIEWTPKSHQCSKCLQTRWYVADSPGPAILGLPSSSKLWIIQLNCTGKLTSRCDPPSPPRKPTTEHAKVRCDLTSPLNSIGNLIKAYQFEGYWSILWNVPHHCLWWCQTCGTCTQEASNCYVTPGTWETRWVHWPRYYCSSWRAYLLGLFTFLLMWAKWETMGLLGPKGSCYIY